MLRMHEQDADDSQTLYMPHRLLPLSYLDRTHVPQQLPQAQLSVGS